nr:histone deacetylase 6 [Hymenolepis microstoma]
MKTKSRSSSAAQTSCLDESKFGKGTGICFDKRMERHRHEWFLEEQECPKRVARALKVMEGQGLISRCTRIPARHVTDEELLKVHSKDYIDLVKSSAKMSKDELYNLSGNYDGVFFNSHTWEASSLAAGSVTELASQIASSKVVNGLALVRPPGHHAMYDEACGYCIFGNVSIAVASLLDSPPLSLYNPTPSKVEPAASSTSSKNSLRSPRFKRILIIDWDVHQGQGTQYTFYNDNRVLFISIHRYECQKFWPMLREGDFDFIGDDVGRGFNINIPLNKTGMTDGDYLAIFYSLIMPIAYEFNPEIVFVSSGFDAAVGDPEGKMWISPACYGHMTHQLRTLADGKLVIVLEGGYFIDSLEEGCVQVLKALLGDYIPPIQKLNPPSKRPLVKKVIWPEENPELPQSVIAKSQKMLCDLTASSSKKPNKLDIVIVLPSFLQSSLNEGPLNRWSKELNLNNQIQIYEATQTDSTDEETTTPKKKSRLTRNSSSERSCCDSSESLENAIKKWAKDGFRVALVMAQYISPDEIISSFNEIKRTFNGSEENLSDRSLSAKSSFCSLRSKRRSSLRTSTESANVHQIECVSKILYIDLVLGKELSPDIFGDLKSPKKASDSTSKTTRVLAFSFASSGSEVELNQSSSQLTLIKVPLNCCKSACKHVTANVLTVMTAMVLPMAFEFSPDLLIISIGDAITNERAELPEQSLTHVVFMLKNVATRLVILTPFKSNPENLLDCLLDASPPGPFKANQLTIAGSKIQERICEFIQEYKRHYKCFPITCSLPCWCSDGASMNRGKGRRMSL